MNDETRLTMLYEDMYQFMIKKDTDKLVEILSEEFALHHMAGMVQEKQEFFAGSQAGNIKLFLC